MDFEGAIKRPFQDIKKFVIGALLNIIPIVNFLSYGFALKAAKASIKKDKKLPEWKDWGGLFVKGLLGVLISLIWMLPAIAVMLLFGGAAFMSIVGGATSVANTAAAGSSILLAMVLALVAWYFLPLAILTFVDKDEFSAGFDFASIIKKAMNTAYFIPWIVSALIGVVLTAIGSAIPVINIMLAPAASFASMIIMFTLIGEAYNAL